MKDEAEEEEDEDESVSGFPEATTADAAAAAAASVPLSTSAEVVDGLVPRLLAGATLLTVPLLLIEVLTGSRQLPFVMVRNRRGSTLIEPGSE